jgi:hypothetical protein
MLYQAWGEGGVVALTQLFKFIIRPTNTELVQAAVLKKKPAVT